MRPRQFHFYRPSKIVPEQEQQNPLRLELQEVFFVLAQKQAKACPAFITLARRTAMETAFSSSYARIQKATGCTAQAELAQRLGIRQCFLYDCRCMVLK